MTKEIFNELFADIKSRTIKSTGSLTYDLYEDDLGRKAGRYDRGQVHKIWTKEGCWVKDAQHNEVREEKL